MAINLAEEGMNLFLTNVDIKDLEKTTKEIAELGTEVYKAKCDVSEIEDLQNAKEEFYSNFDKLDLLINNAGVVIGGSLLGINLEDLKKVLDMNLWGVINSLNVFLPELMETHHGHIIPEYKTINIEDYYQ